LWIYHDTFEDTEGYDEHRTNEEGCYGDEYLEKIADFIDLSFGKEVLGSGVDPYKDDGGKQYYDFVIDEFYDETFEFLRNSKEEHLEENIAKEAKKYFDFLVHVHEELSTFVEKQHFYILDRKVVRGEIIDDDDDDGIDYSDWDHY
jgi:hypothetical protein